MASANERWLRHLELTLTNKDDTHEPFNLSKILHQLCEKKTKIGEHVYDDERWMIYVSDIKYFPNIECFVILFFGIDKESGEKSYADMETLDLRTIKKKITEGGATSAHLCIREKPYKSSSRHRATLEEADGLSRTRVIKLLKDIIDKYSEFTERHGRNSSRLEATVFNDDPLESQLEKRSIISIDLIQEGGKGCIDTEEGYTEKNRVIHLKPTGRPHGLGAKNLIQRITNTEKYKDYPKLRIKMIDDNGKQKTSRAENKAKEALASSFQKQSLIQDITPPLSDATQSIINHFVFEMSNTMNT